MKLYLIRHSETDWNIERRLQGRSNIPLNKNGQDVAEQTARGMSQIPFHIMYTSPLLRAKETAAIISRNRKIEIREEEDIQEISFGVYEGCYVSKERYNVPDESFRNFFEDTDNYNPPEDGESVEELIERVQHFLDEMIALYQDTEKNIAVVSHGATIRAMLTVIENKRVDQLWDDGVPPNCGVSTVMYAEKEWHVLEKDKVYWRAK